MGAASKLGVRVGQYRWMGVRGRGGGITRCYHDHGNGIHDESCMTDTSSASYLFVIAN